MIPWLRRKSAGARFLILFPGRTGSSWLVDGLCRHPRIRADGEILVGRSPDEQRSTLRRLYAGRRTRSAIGFKTKLKDVADLDLLRSCIVENELVVFLMRRRDLLRLAISRINARRLHAETGRWNVRASDRAVSGADVAVEELVDALVRCRDDVLRLDDFIASSGVVPCEIEYADILEDPDGVLAMVQQWLGVEHRPLASSVVKNTNQDLAAAVGNIETLRRELASSEWSSVFDVDPISERRSSREG